jgi:hypothetical protein
MKEKLKPILQLINTLILSQLQVVVGDDPDLSVTASLNELLLKTENAPGVTIQGLELDVKDIALPSSNSPIVGATVGIAKVDVLFASAFWPRLIPVVKERLVGNLGDLLDKIEVRGLHVCVQLLPSKRVNAAITFDRISIVGGGRSGVTVENGQIVVENFNPKEKNKKLALKETQVTIYSLKVSVAQNFMNRAYDVVRSKIPSVIKSVDIALDGSTMKLKVRAFLPFDIPVNMSFKPENNRFGIYLAKVFMPGAGTAITKLVEMFTKGRPEVSVSGNNILVDPWKKIPIPIECRLDQFEVYNESLIIGFGRPNKLSALLEPGQVTLARPAIASGSTKSDELALVEPSDVDPIGSDITILTEESSEAQALEEPSSEPEVTSSQIPPVP